jgi:C-terminal processing protease CtpA/Prc
MPFHFHRTVGVSLCIALLLTTCSCKKKMSDARRAEHVASLDYVWKTVNEKHYDTTFGNINWKAAGDELRPLMLNVQTDARAADILNQLVGRLKLSHYAIVDEHAVDENAVGKTAVDQSAEKSASESKKIRNTFVPAIVADTPANDVQFGNLPPMPLRYAYKKLPDANVGYFYLSVFLDPPGVMKAFRAALKQAEITDGLIIDLRHNPGGLGIMAMGMGNLLVSDANQKLGTMYQRNSKLDFVLNPQAHPYKKPVAVLIDSASGSTAEILAGGLQDIGRARIFGTRSAGQALPSLVELLPNGFVFQYAVANYISTGGKTLEANGVTPDEIIHYAQPYTPPDPVIAAASQWITLQSKINP